MNKLAFIKRMSYFIMAVFFYLSYLFPVNKKKILLIMTHDSTEEGNVGSTYCYFQKQDPNLIFKEVNRENYAFKINKDLFKNLIYMFIVVPYHMATSRIIFMDNVFLPFSAVKLKKNTELVQLWHGTGALKKFGLDCEEGWIKNLAVDTNKNTTHFIVGSRWMKNIYKTAFEAEDDKIFSIGCPRTDLFFNKTVLQEKRDEFFQSYPELSDKKIVLYAPTFRDDEYSACKIKLHLDIDKLMSNLDDSYALGLRLHPRIADKINLDEYYHGQYQNKVFDFSTYDKLNTLLICCDILITDYSSIIYEYALMKKPMIFYSYDLSKFKEFSRGFYEDYKTTVPGPVVFNTEQVADLIKNYPAENYNLDKFTDIYLENCDGNSRKRLYDLLMP